MVATPSAARATTPPFLYSLSVSEIPFGFAYADCDYPYFLLVVPFYCPTGMCFLLFHHWSIPERCPPTTSFTQRELIALVLYLRYSWNRGVISVEM